MLFFYIFGITTEFVREKTDVKKFCSRPRVKIMENLIFTLRPAKKPGLLAAPNFVEWLKLTPSDRSKYSTNIIIEIVVHFSAKSVAGS